VCSFRASLLHAPEFAQAHAQAQLQALTLNFLSITKCYPVAKPSQKQLPGAHTAKAALTATLHKATHTTRAAHAYALVACIAKALE